jgi:hypothetical protein
MYVCIIDAPAILANIVLVGTHFKDHQKKKEWGFMLILEGHKPWPITSTQQPRGT